MKMGFWILWMVFSSALLARKGHSALTNSECSSGIKSVTEGSNVTLTCGQYYTKVEWYTSHDSELRNYIGMCDGTSCDPTANEQFSIRATFTNWYKTELEIRNVTREQTLFFHCYDNYYRTITSCRLQITVFPVYTNDSCSVNVTNWMVTGSCTIKGMYSSDNNYMCGWTQGGNSNQQFGGFQAEPKSYVAENSRSYTEGVCSFAKPMPLSPGYYIYRMRVSPGSGVYFEKRIYIDPPYQVKVKHNCPKYVFEGFNLSCECFATTTASPPALIVWEGTHDAALLLTNISRKMSEVQFTCRLQWGPDGYIKDSTSYGLNVAYGPSDVLITLNKITTEDVSETISFTCTATDVYPSAVFRWNVTCYNQTDYGNFSKCSLNFTQMVESLSILCNASNTYFPDAYFSYVYVQSSEEDKQKGKAQLNVGLIGGVIAAVLLLIIIVAVLIVYIIKRRKGMLDSERGFLGIFSGHLKRFNHTASLSMPHAVVNKPQTQTPIRRQAAPSGDLYTVTSTTSAGHVVDDYAAICKTTHSNVVRTKSNSGLQITPVVERNLGPTVAKKPTTKTKPTLRNKSDVQNLHDTGYMNVTEVPTDSGLGVYHVVPWATTSESAEHDTSEYSLPTISEDEYNELHFEEDRTGQEDQADNYHHLGIT